MDKVADEGLGTEYQELGSLTELDKYDAILSTYIRMTNRYLIDNWLVSPTYPQDCLG